MNLSSLKFLLADEPPVNPTASLLHTVIFIGGMLLVFWFLLIQPQRKRDKDLKTMLGALRPGDKVTTTSGIVGLVVTLKEKNVIIRSSDTKLEILKSAIGEITERGGSGNESAGS